MAVMALSTSPSVSQSAPVCCTLRCPESEPTGQQPPLASFPSLSSFLTPLPLPTSTAQSLGVRSQSYVTPKAQILPQHQADNLPSEADREARPCLQANSFSTAAAFLAFHACFLRTDSRPRCLAVYPKSRRVFFLFFKLGCIKEAIMLGVLALDAPSSSLQPRMCVKWLTAAQGRIGKTMKMSFLKKSQLNGCSNYWDLYEKRPQLNFGNSQSTSCSFLARTVDIYPRLHTYAHLDIGWSRGAETCKMNSHKSPLLNP